MPFFCFLRSVWAKDANHLHLSRDQIPLSFLFFFFLGHVNCRWNPCLVASLAQGCSSWENIFIFISILWDGRHIKCDDISYLTPTLQYRGWFLLLLDIDGVDLFSSWEQSHESEKVRSVLQFLYSLSWCVLIKSERVAFPEKFSYKYLQYFPCCEVSYISLL